MAGPSGADARSTLAHLFRRAAFGARPEELDAAVAAGYDATVEMLLAQVAQPGAPVPPPALPKPKDANPLVPWWTDLMVSTRQPAREKLVLYWHGHFATSNVGVSNGAFMAQQNNLFRAMGGGDFEPLVQAVVKDPAMLLWLNGNTNVKAHPNENLARELMELFTMGVGNYSESDVKEAARCLTGWRVAPVAGVAFTAGRHDPGVKTVMGQTGAFGTDDLVRIIVESDVSARFVAARVYSHYARPIAAADPIAADLASAYVASGRNVTALLRAVFTHPDFISPATRTGLVKQPVEWLVGAVRAVHAAAPGARSPGALNALGQRPFYPPNVGGWGQNRYWLSTAANLARVDFAAALAKTADLTPITAALPADRPAAAAHLLAVDGWSSSSEAALRDAAGSPQLLFALALASPEYVLA